MSHNKKLYFKYFIALLLSMGFGMTALHAASEGDSSSSAVASTPAADSPVSKAEEKKDEAKDKEDLKDLKAKKDAEEEANKLVKSCEDATYKTAHTKQCEGAQTAQEKAKAARVAAEKAEARAKAKVAVDTTAAQWAASQKAADDDAVQAKAADDALAAAEAASPQDSDKVKRAKETKEAAHKKLTVAKAKAETDKKAAEKAAEEKKALEDQALEESLTPDQLKKKLADEENAKAQAALADAKKAAASADAAVAKAKTACGNKQSCPQLKDALAAQKKAYEVLNLLNQPSLLISLGKKLRDAQFALIRAIREELKAKRIYDVALRQTETPREAALRIFKQLDSLTRYLEKSFTDAKEALTEAEAKFKKYSDASPADQKALALAKEQVDLAKKRIGRISRNRAEAYRALKDARKKAAMYLKEEQAKDKYDGMGDEDEDPEGDEGEGPEGDDDEEPEDGALDDAKDKAAASGDDLNENDGQPGDGDQQPPAPTDPFGGPPPIDTGDGSNGFSNPDNGAGFSAGDPGMGTGFSAGDPSAGGGFSAGDPGSGVGFSDPGMGNNGFVSPDVGTGFGAAPAWGDQPPPPPADAYGEQGENLEATATEKATEEDLKEGKDPEFEKKHDMPPEEIPEEVKPASEREASIRTEGSEEELKEKLRQADRDVEDAQAQVDAAKESGDERRVIDKEIVLEQAKEVLARAQTAQAPYGKSIQSSGLENWTTGWRKDFLDPEAPDRGGVFNPRADTSQNVSDIVMEGSTVGESSYVRPEPRTDLIIRPGSSISSNPRLSEGLPDFPRNSGIDSL